VENEAAAISILDASKVEMRALAFAVGFFFSFRLCIVLLCVNLLRLEPSTGTAISLLFGLLLFYLVCFNCVGESERNLGSVFRLAPARWTLIFLAFSGLSLAWSETASITNSAAYWSGLLLDVATVALLVRSDVSNESSHSILKGFIWSTCCLAVIAWVMPAASDLRLGDEQYFNPNQICNICALGIFFAQYLSRSRSGEWRYAKLLLIVTLIRSLSKTTLAAFFVSESLLLVIDRSMSRKSKLIVIASALILLVIFWGLFVAYFDYYTNNGNQAETLTGRIVIWLYVLAGVTDHPWTPWIGHGFDSWWKVVPPFGGQLFEARHAENELLQQIYAYGAAGVVLLLGVYGSLFRQLRKLRCVPEKAVFLALLVFIGVRGLAEAEPFDLLLPLWSVLLICLMAASQNEVEPEM
jgi:exopolysaccharide production protein ExoQ